MPLRIRNDVVDIQEIRNKRDQLQEELHSIYKGSPRTISKAYREAQKL